MSIVEGIENHVEYIPEIISGTNIPGIKNENFDTHSVKLIHNLEQAWRHMIDILDIDIDLDTLININKLLAKDDALYVGQLRNTVGFVAGIHRVPIPKERNVKQTLKKAQCFDNSLPTDIHKAFSLYLYIITSQLFVDGNKRTAYIILNKLLLEMSIGIIIISESKLEQYNMLLHSYYISKSEEDQNEMIKFLKDECLHYM